MENPIVKQQIIKTSFGNIEFLSSGNGPKKLLFFPGFLANIESWFSTIYTHFNPLGYEIFLLIPPGHGLSYKINYNYQYKIYIDSVIEAIENLGEIFDLSIGYSVGGGVAWNTGALIPKFSKKIVLIDPVLSPLSWKLLIIRFTHHIINHINNRFSKKIKETPNIFRPLPTTHWHISNIPGFLSEIFTLQTTPHGHLKRKQVLILWGKNDDISPIKDNLPAIELPPHTKVIYFKGDHFWFSCKQEELIDDIKKFTEENN